MIRENKNKLLQSLGKNDFIIVSPLKRTIQTALYLFENINLEQKMYITPLVTEIGFITENIGNSKNEICNDSDLCQLCNFDKLTFDNCDESLFYYNFGWNFENNKSIEIWNDFLMWNNPYMMIKEFKIFLSNDRFTNKNVVIFSHYMFINILLNKCPNNLGIVTFIFNQETKEISNIQFIDTL